MSSFQDALEVNRGEKTFGQQRDLAAFSDHMTTIRYNMSKGWHDSQTIPYAPFTFAPGSVALHYAQLIFEGLKALRSADGSILLFRPEMNARRFNQSARRLAMPEIPEATFLSAITRLVEKDRQWVPQGAWQSLYLRPFMFPLDESIALKAADDYLFCVIASPLKSYPNPQCVCVWICETFSRSGFGGTGLVKCGANYAASMAAYKEARKHDCQHALFLDSASERYVEDMSGMNIMFVEKSGRVLTPSLSETVLPGITRDSILALMRDDGVTVEERPCQIDEVLQKIKLGEITEAFACGTTSSIISIGKFRSANGDFVIGNGISPGKVSQSFLAKLTAIQYGLIEDTRGWTRQIA